MVSKIADLGKVPPFTHDSRTHIIEISNIGPLMHSLQLHTISFPLEKKTQKEKKRKGERRFVAAMVKVVTGMIGYIFTQHKLGHGHKQSIQEGVCGLDRQRV